MISIVTVTWNSYDWLGILLESINLYTKIDHEIIVVDNSSKPEPIKNVKHIVNKENIGHGEGLNLGIKHASYPFILILDVDCHILCHNWENQFLELINDYDVIGGMGVPRKPIRPACMFLKSEIAQKYDLSATPGYAGIRGDVPGFDVAIQAYYKMLDDNIKIKLIESIPSRYQTISGEEWCLKTPVVYHHWSGPSMHLECRKNDYFGQSLENNKQKLFNQIPWRIL